MYPVKDKITFVILIYLFFTSWQVSSSSLQKTVPNVEYQRYDEPEGKEYQQFLQEAPEGRWYYTRMKGIGNVDNTPEKEEVVLITTQYSHEAEYYGQALLLVCTKEEGILKKKELIEIYNYEVEEALNHYAYPPLVFRKTWKFRPNNGRLKLVNLNKDGMLDVFVELWFSGGSYAPYYIAVVSFQNEGLKRIFNKFAGVGGYPSELPEYIDIDKDGVYEIKIPNEVFIEGIEHSASPTWIDLYEWDGKEYVINNRKFYSRDTSLLIDFMERYIFQLRGWPQRRERYFEEYEFYLGLMNYYRGDFNRAKEYLNRIVEKAKNENYVREAQAILKRLAETGKKDFVPREKK